MNTHPDIERLSAYIDDELEPSTASELERHLAACDDCRGEIDALETLRADAARLETSIEPERELWPGIAAGIERERTVELAPGRMAGAGDRPGAALWRYRYPLAAAAVLLVGFSSVGTLVLTRQGATRPGPVAVAPAPSGATDSPPADLAGGVENGRATRPANDRPAGAARTPANGAVVPVGYAGHDEYQGAIEALEATLAQRADQLDPQTVETVRQNLEIIDAAIQDARAALDADPGNSGLSRTVTATYKTKLQLLRRAVELPATT